MTNEELISKIKAEIERLKEEASIGLSEYDAGYENGICKTCNDLLTFLSTLESEKPIEQDDLEKEIQKYLESKGVGYGGWIDGWKDEDLREIARHFAQWQKEQMMKEAVEGEVCIPNVWVEHQEGKELVVRAEISKELGFKFGDKVRIIICKKED